MKRQVLFGLAGVLVVFVCASAVKADDCGALSGVISSGECQISTAVTTSGAFTLAETLHILNTGKITVSPVASGLTLNITGGLIMDSTVAGSAQIVGDASGASGVGANIVVNATGDILLHGSGTTGASITASQVGAGSCSGGGGGNITLITTLGHVTTEEGSLIAADAKCSAGQIVILGTQILIAGTVRSESGLSGTGAKQAPGGGPITIKAGCDLVVTETGIVSSQGLDPGADLVHLEGGCNVSIFGLVQSTGHGHATPNTPTNHCYYQTSGFLKPPNTTGPDPANPRLDKPDNSTACVEVWAGKNLLIDATAGNSGEVNVDLDLGAGHGHWIDLFAGLDITITTDSTTAFVVHANEGGDNGTGGLITVKSVGGKLTMSGAAIQADGGGSGVRVGGIVTAEALNSVTLDGAIIEATGVYNSGNGKGGTLSVRSSTSSISWLTGTGDVTPTGTGIPVPNRGTITLTYCTGLTSGATFPFTTAQSNPIPVAACGPAPTLPSYVTLPTCACQVTPPGCKWCTKSAVLSQVTQNMGFCCAVPDILVDLRLASNTVDPTKVGTDQPATGSIQAAVDYLMLHGDVNTPTHPADGQLFIGVTAKDCGTGTVVGGACGGQTGRGPYGGGVENVVIQNTRTERLNVFGCSVNLAAKNVALPVITILNGIGKVTVLDIHVSGSSSDGYLIQNNADLIVVKNARSMNNGVAGYQINDDDVQITGSPEISGNGAGIVIAGDDVILRTNKVLNNFGVGIDATGSRDTIRDEQVQGNAGTGIRAQGNDNTVHENDVYLNTGDGINVTGDNNEVDKNSVGDKSKANSGNGIRVQGNGNTLDENDVYLNGGDGIDVVGSGNTITQNNLGDKAKGNVGTGLSVAGPGNLIQENEAYANGGDGISVSGGTSGSSNILVKNQAGDRGIGNSGNGIVVAGNGNGTPDPVEIDQNTTKSNKLDGIKISGSGQELKKNQSGGSSAADKNGTCAFNVTAGNFNAKDNKANNVTLLPNTDGAAFPTGCKN